MYKIYRRGFSAIISLFFGMFVSYYANNVSLEIVTTDPNEAIDEALVGLIFSLLTFIAFEIYGLRNDVLKNNKMTGNNWKLIEKFSNRIDYMDKFGRILTSLHSNDQVIKDSGIIALNNFIDAFDVEDGKVKFIGEKISLDAFEALWSSMIRESSKNRSKVRAYAVHVVSARIWNEDYSNRLIDLQRHFMKTNGEVYRIFVESPATDIDIGNYDKAMQKMDAAKINNCILRVPELPAQLAGTMGEAYHDFIIFDDFDTYTKWDIDPFARRIMGTVTSRVRNKNDPNYNKVKGLWNSLIDRVLDCDFDNINNGEEEKNFSPDMIRISKEFQEKAETLDLKLSSIIEPAQ